ncbi:MAG: dihydrolipoamide acetyltransferase family protein [Oryzomonas sp.]|jgi:pyruvate dehydrogenase E2 component (dihydrolipoamide acetyltransferase)
MPFEFRLPDLGEGIAEVELRRWLVKDGDRVAEHQAMVEVETDKAVVEVPSPHRGTVARIRRQEGETVRVGEVLLEIAGEGEIPKSDLGERPRSVGIVGILPEPDSEPVVRATPMARKLAQERGIDLTGVRGSGPHGSITPEDLEQSAGPAQPPGEDFGPVERLPLRGVRRSIARNLIASQRLTAFVTTMEEADVTDLWRLREREQQAVEARGTHMTFLPFFIKAAQHALREHPSLNAAIDDATETVIIKKHYHFGIAVETPDGLMVPVIRDVERKSIIELAAEIQELGRKARERTIGLNELKGSSFTITNYGHFGGVFATPIINWPDVAILGFGRIVERPWVHRGEIAIRKILPLSLTFDHRVADGAEAGQFLAKVVRYLEDLALLFIESV